MKTDKKLSLICPISRDDGPLIYVYASPFPYEVVEKHRLMLGSPFTSFIAQIGGLGAACAAVMMLRKKLEREQELRGKDEVKEGVQGQQAPNTVDEIQHQATVIFNDSSQWRSVSLDSTVKQGIISADKFREVRGEIVLFTVSSTVQKPEFIKPTVRSVVGMFDGQLTLSTAAEWRGSLPTSKADTDTPSRNVLQETPFTSSQTGPLTRGSDTQSGKQLARNAPAHPDIGSALLFPC